MTISSHTLRIRYRPPEYSMMIELATIQALKLTRNLQDAKSNACLLGLLNHTKTPMGLGMLRGIILQPSTAWDPTIVQRHAAVYELTSNEEMFSEVREGKALYSVPLRVADLRRLTCVQALSEFAVAKKTLTQVLRSWLFAISCNVSTC